MKTRTKTQTTAAIPLFKKGEERPSLFECAHCRGLSRVSMVGVDNADEAEDAARKYAQNCCQRNCSGCDKEITTPSYTACGTCRNKEREKREMRTLKNATKVMASDYKHPLVYWDGEYLFVEQDAGSLEDLSMAFGCTPFNLSFDARCVVEQALFEHHDEAWESVSEDMLKELQEFLDAWSSKVGIVSYFDDKSVLVVFGRSDLESSDGSDGYSPDEIVKLYS